MAELTIDPTTTALVAIDLQHGIVNLETVPHDSYDVVKRTAQIAESLRKKGGYAMFVRVTNAEDGADAIKVEADVIPPASPAPKPSHWADLVNELGVGKNDVIITKRQWGAFYGTDLELHLRRRGIKTIVMTGIATNIGVESTARDAYERGFNQIIVEDACAALSEEAHNHSFNTTFGRFAKVRSTEQVLEALS